MDHNHDAIAKVIETIEALPSRVRVCPQWLLVTVGVLALIGGITGPLALWIATSQVGSTQEANPTITVERPETETEAHDRRVQEETERLQNGSQL